MSAARLAGPRPERPPVRLIIDSTAPRRNPVYSRRPGLIAVSTLDCGHITDTNARERRAGRLACWECFYLRPAGSMGALIAAEAAGLTEGP